MQHPLRIAHDLDMTHFPFFDIYFRQIREEMGIQVFVEELDRYDWLHFLEEKIGLGHDDALRIMRNTGEKLLAHHPPYEGSVESFNRLSQRYEAHIITARGSGDDPNYYFDNVHEHTHTHLSLYNYEIPSSRVHFRNDKLACMAENLVDVLFDDCPAHALEAARAGKIVILRDHPYNQPTLHPQDIKKFGMDQTLWKALLSCGQIRRAKTYAEAEAHIEEVSESRRGYALP